MPKHQLFSDAHLNTLREHYGKIERVDPCGETWQAVERHLKKCGRPALEQLAHAKIKFISILAQGMLRDLNVETYGVPRSSAK